MWSALSRVDRTGAAEALDHLTLTALWYASYGFCFVCMFTVLPVHAEALNRGERFWTNRLYESIRYNLTFFAVCTLVGVIGIGALLLRGTLTLDGLVGFLTGASNAFGLFLSLFLMGYGLVEIPKLAWRSADYITRERLATHLAGVRANQLEKAHDEMITCALCTRHLKTYMRHGPGADHLLEVSDEAERDLTELGLLAAAARAVPDREAFDDQDYDDEVGMAKLHRRLKASRTQYQRALVRLPRAVYSAIELSDRRTAGASGSFGSRFESTLSRPSGALRDGALYRQLEWVWKCRLAPLVARLAALLLALMSATVVYSQVTIAAGCGKWNLFSQIVHYGHQCDKVVWAPFAHVLVLLPLMYICWATLFGLFKIEVYSTFVLTKHASDGYSMLTCALLMCRLSPVIAYNFLRITCVDDGRCSSYFHDACAAANTEAECDTAGTVEGAPSTLCAWDAASSTCSLPKAVADTFQTVFYTNIGKQIDEAPLVGKNLNEYVPALLLLHVFLLVIGLYDRLCGICSPTQRFRFSHEDDMHEDQYMIQGRHTLREVRNNIAEGRPPLEGLPGTGQVVATFRADAASASGASNASAAPAQQQLDRQPRGRSWEETKTRLAAAAGRASRGEGVGYKHTRRGSVGVQLSRDPADVP